MGKELKVFKPKLSRVEVKEEGGIGFVEGYASVFGNVDSDGEVVEKGAFGKTLKENLLAGKIKFVDFHNSFLSSEEIIGVVEEAKEDEHGLWFKARLSSVQRAQDVRTKIREGILDALSIGYNVMRDEVIEGVRHLKELRLWEISVVPWGANSLAGITNVKSALSQELEKFKEVSQLEIGEQELKEINPQIQEVINNLQALVKQVEPENSTHQDDKPPEDEVPEPDQIHSEEEYLKELGAEIEALKTSAREMAIYQQLNDFGKSLKNFRKDDEYGT